MRFCERAIVECSAYSKNPSNEKPFCFYFINHTHKLGLLKVQLTGIIENEADASELEGRNC